MVQLDLQVPSGIAELLRVLQDALGMDYKVTLAGGYLRDTFGRAPIKDIDIMVSPTMLAPWITLDDIMKRLDKACIPDWFYAHSTVNTDYIEGMKERGVQSILMGESPNMGMEAQLIIYDKPMSADTIAHDMDLNICQIVMVPSGSVYATNEFLEGFDDKLIKVLRGVNHEREKERVERMLKKYPGFKVAK